MARAGWLSRADRLRNPDALKLTYNVNNVFSIWEADDWLDNLLRPFEQHNLPLDLNASDDEIVQLAENTAKCFEQGIVYYG
ncbi:Uncharacterised protein [Kingella negevensis]|uniref:Uncharacterized protein n=1 Tax=Kingella negevensis TaxID=1522312 RepID=A0A238TB80_9NEIS|nr:Uncharacterised protein [Kingella negevensis]